MKEKKNKIGRELIKCIYGELNTYEKLCGQVYGVFLVSETKNVRTYSLYLNLNYHCFFLALQIDFTNEVSQVSSASIK